MHVARNHNRLQTEFANRVVKLRDAFLRRGSRDRRNRRHAIGKFLPDFSVHCV